MAAHPVNAMNMAFKFFFISQPPIFSNSWYQRAPSVRTDYHGNFTTSVRHEASLEYGTKALIRIPFRKNQVILRPVQLLFCII